MPRPRQAAVAFATRAEVRRRLAPLILLPLLAGAAPVPALVRVRLDTSAGPIVLALEARRAPVTTANFLRYVDAGRFDGTRFYRAARNTRDPKVGLVQGGIDHNIPRSFFPIAHEPTTKTGLHHVDGTISMARNDPGTAMGDFFIVVGPSTYLDAKPGGGAGYAAFGHVVGGMDVVRRILALPTFPGGYSIEMKGQTIRDPVTITRARRLP